ncbi:hypothetical protein [Halomonas sp. NO4]|uniref:hypothetical protein n=1 Tax=Halomonas sp. NO4 TaxID=2484813 RepID=UPI0013D4C241|nr:hypothetical protein [Halomonas sp. NO4]
MTDDTGMDVSPSWQELKDERDALAAHQKALVFELSACQGVLHSLARSGEVTREYADDAKAVLQRTPHETLARHDAELLQSVLAGIPGCGDNSCCISKPVGMGTNGGCRCFEDRRKAGLVIQRLGNLLSQRSHEAER